MRIFVFNILKQNPKRIPKKIIPDARKKFGVGKLWGYMHRGHRMTLIKMMKNVMDRGHLMSF